VGTGGHAGVVAGKVAIVTGAARGIGARHAALLANEGATVVLADVLDETGAEVARGLGPSVVYAHLDVRSSDEWRELARSVLERYGRIDVLVNNAAIPPTRERAEDTSDASWQNVLDINLSGTFYGVRAVVPAMKAAGAGSIINVSSVQGLRGSSRFHGYVASKFAVRGLTKSLAAELGRHGIRVNSVHPGLIRTPATESFDESALTIPLRRAGDPDEVARMVVFLASDASSYSTGCEFVADGGLTAVI
jgi:3alpha(or 20beta)-hydroxysteroid dehydrogenase